MALSPDVVDSVVNSNMKNLGDSPALTAINVHNGFGQAAVLAAQNAVTTQQNMNQLGASFVGSTINRLHNLDPVEASAMNTVASGDLAQAIAQLGSVVAALQQIVKTAQTTPPPTAG